MLRRVNLRRFSFQLPRSNLGHGYRSFCAAASINQSENAVKQSIATKEHSVFSSSQIIFDQPSRHQIISSLQRIKKTYSYIFKSLMVACEDTEIREMLSKSIPTLATSYVTWSLTQKTKNNTELEKESNRSISDNVIVDALLSPNVFSALKNRSFTVLEQTKNPRLALTVASLAYHCNTIVSSDSALSSSLKPSLALTIEESNKLIQSLIENSDKSSIMVCTTLIIKIVFTSHTYIYLYIRDDHLFYHFMIFE